LNIETKFLRNKQGRKMKIRKLSCVLISVAALQACSTAQQAELDKKVAALTTCEKVNALVAGHSKGFPQLRAAQTTSKYMDMWRARYNLVGEGCQVWGWGNAKFSYVCSLTEPSEQVAMEHFEQAKKITHECLGDSWSMKQGKRKQGDGVKAEFSVAGKNTVITVVAASSPTLFASEWKTYYFVGDEADLK
jgi:hypothetical protein